jgi:putative thioredoxin
MGNESPVIDMTEANFVEIVGQSRQLPVLVDFWADWCAPCKQLSPVIEKLAREWQGKVLVVKVNADREPMITQQFGVKGLPTLKLVFQGQLAGELVGAQPEAAIRKLLAPFLSEDEAGDPNDDFHAQVMAAAEAGHTEDAMAALREKLASDKDDHRSREMLAEILLQEGRLDETAEVLADTGSVAALKRVNALLAFARRTESLPSLAELEQVAVADPGSDTHYRLALRLVTANRLESGLDLLLQVMRSDRQYGEDAARRTLLEIFDMLGRDDPLTLHYRKRMASMLY